MNNRITGRRGRPAQTRAAAALAFGIAVLAAPVATPVAAMAAAAPADHPNATGAVLDAQVRERRFAEGVAAYDAGDHARAYEIWLPLARGGDLAAQRNVGHLLRHGKGVGQDLPRALAFYERAGRGGLVSAQVNAAFMHLNGEGADADPKAAAFWFDGAARAGVPLAQYNLGLMYEAGRGVDRDMGRALGWYSRAARAGHELALQRLDILVADLPGPPEPASVSSPAAPAAIETDSNPPPDMSVEAAEPDTQVRLPTPITELFVRESEAVPAPPAPTVPTAAVVDATAPDQGPDRVTAEQGARFMQGKFHYEQGDYDDAARIWAALAAEGVTEAQYRYGQLLVAGLGVERNASDAYTWLSQAAADGHEDAAEAAAALRPQLSSTAPETAE